MILTYRYHPASRMIPRFITPPRVFVIVRDFLLNNSNLGYKTESLASAWDTNGKVHVPVEYWLSFCRLWLFFGIIKTALSGCTLLL